MDKKNIFLGTLFAIAAVLCFYVTTKFAPPPPAPAPVAAAVAAPASAASAAATPDSLSAAPDFALAAHDNAGASVATLRNGFIEVHFTDFGGAIRDVEIVARNRDGSLTYPERLDTPLQPFDLNRRHKDAMLAFVGVPGLDSKTRFQLVRQTASEVDYQVVVDGKLKVTRRYVLAPDTGTTTDPYQLRTETVLENLGTKPYSPPALMIALGTAAAVNAQDRGYQLTTGYYENGYTTITRAKLEPSGGVPLIGAGAHGATPEIESRGPMQWACVSNQFFASILTPDQPLADLVTRRVKLDSALPDSDSSAYGITADAQFAVAPIPAKKSVTLGGSLYVGPKEYHRLANPDVFRANQERVMNFGFFRFFSALLLTLMTWMHSGIPNWGVAIILTTLLLKIFFVPFTLAASRSAKRMQKLQPELKLLKEKYKDNPQKQQAETMELFKKHKVNPVGGCLPMLITLPFFWGFFQMLRSAAELRFAPFLWARDLSSPDTVATIHGIDINILPIILGVVMLVQMRFTPQPTVDSSQQKMMKFMPLMFMFFYYNYSCALSLYSAVNAVTTIIQQAIINRMKEPEPVAVASGAVRGGKTLKNVGPRRK